jgi:hypothetical protein
MKKFNIVQENRNLETPDFELVNSVNNTLSIIR